MSGTNCNNTIEVVLLGDVNGSVDLLLSSENILGSTKIVVSTKVVVRCEAFSGDLDNLVVEESLKSIDDTEKLNIFSVFSESKETIDDVVATGGWSTELKQSNLLRSVNLV